MDHWLSFNTVEGPEGNPGGNGCIISVVLEDNAKFAFSGVRILVVYSPEGPLEDLDVVECLDSTRFRLPAESRASYRQTLMRRASATRRGKDLSAKSPESLCTVVFEIIDASDSRYFIYELAPSSLSNLEKRRGIRAAFDRVYPCSPADPPVHVILNSSHSFRPIAILAMPTFDPVLQDRSRIYHHSVRVIPVSRSNSPIPELLPNILRLIVKLALVDKSTGWRKRLLAYGLVCKSWTHVLDLALGGFEEAKEGDHPGVTCVARLLNMRPERGAAIRIFDPSIFEYNIPPPGPLADEKWEAILSILRHATSVEIVRLSYIHPSFVQKFFALLKNLSRVQTCVMTFPNPTNKLFRGPKIAVHDMLAAITSWEQLESLELSNLSGTSDMNSVHPPPAPKFKLRKLTIEGSVLHGPQLMAFATTQRLTTLHLIDVRDLPNQDMLAFLTTVAPTIMHLAASRCNFARAANEEHAIDAAITLMPNLMTLVTDGFSVSTLVLSRKRKHAVTARPTGRIVIRPAQPGVTLAGVAEAINFTGWSIVILRWDDRKGWDDTVAMNAKHAAEEQGIYLGCRVGPI